MLSNVDTLLFSWKNWFGKHGSDLWNMVPACLMWLVWKERNRHTFEDMENSLDQSMFARTLFDWSRVRDFTHCSSILEFQVSLRFSLWDLCTFGHFKFIIVNRKCIWFSMKLHYLYIQKYIYIYIYSAKN